jgi:S-DNA-T family DNA segregation ATPase FtsK/SpoIIIE
MVLILSLFIFIIFFFNVNAIHLFQGAADPKPMGNDAITDDLNMSPTYSDEKDNWPQHLDTDEEPSTPVELVNTPPEPAEPVKLEPELQLEITPTEPPKKEKAEPEFIIEERTETDAVAEKLVEEQGAYDPTLDLSSYKFPPLELLNEYDTGKVQVTQDELNQNKDRILATLTNFKIGITSIKATIGPTVTLYEIVPDAGIKISRIKNLEDDIALSLSALGIRIIAPIPGKGTIGIEVPNKNREMVSIRSVLASPGFVKTDKELPVALGKTISNEVLVIDLAKMPHLLVAGATGQGKSVGLNVILGSLLYKRHPSQLKFVLVDPKKVEMSLFSKIERHYLAKLPNSEEAIITDTRKVVHTLNSLCIEMENRYEILKDAGARNLKEYNAKFLARKLNPKDGHRFLPYIVLVIDELADLMMTAGKEVETPIARLAQLARAIGIHLVLATQRPSVNVITGVIKANFPARLSFRVTSKVDSRTILDTGGADQLVGMGDMLLSTGSDVIRLQCPFVDTPEIERICEYIGSQRGYPSAYLLPEYEDEDSGAASVDLAERDALFEEAARLIVMHQQGSTSLIQRKLKLGYNRAGRLIDQLEAAGIVGPFEGSKAREVLIKDEMSLEQLLNGLKEKHG